MSRWSLAVRPACAEDVPVLRELWADIMRPGPEAQQLADVEAVLARCATDDHAEVLVAEVDDVPAGAVYVQATTLTPLNLEPTVLAVSPHVLPQFQRRGVGTALMDAATRFAEVRDIATLATAASAGVRDANRFMARLSLAPQATLRAAATGAVRSRLTARRTAPRAARGARIDRVLAARRIGREHAAG